MNLPDEQFFDDERDWAAQQQVDDEAKQERLTDILRKAWEGVPLSKDETLLLAVGCGIDKRNVT